MNATIIIISSIVFSTSIEKHNGHRDETKPSVFLHFLCRLNALIKTHVRVINVSSAYRYFFFLCVCEYLSDEVFREKKSKDIDIGQF